MTPAPQEQADEARRLARVRPFDRMEILGRLRSIESGGLTRYEQELSAALSKAEKDLEDTKRGLDEVTTVALKHRDERDAAEKELADEKAWNAELAKVGDKLLKERDELREALEGMLDLLDRHAGWCGYNKDAPGDHIINRAPEKARAALTTNKAEGSA